MATSVTPNGADTTPRGVTLGLALPPYEAPDRLWTAARIAERAGFHSVWVTDATLPGYPWLDALSVLGGLTAVTSTAKVGTSIFVPARRNPVLLAHALSSLDHLSEGRLIFGVGVGERMLRPQEWAVAGAPLEHRGAITDEYLTLLKRLWTEEAVSHDGQFFRCEDIALQPKPVRAGDIPIWVGGKAEGALRRAAAFGTGWMPVLVSPEEFEGLWAQLGGYLEAAGRDQAEVTGGVYCFGAIADSYDAARAMIAPGVEGIYHTAFDAFEPFCLVGTADDWLERIDRFAAAGVSHMNVLLFTQDLLGDVEAVGERVAARLAPVLH